MEYWWSDIGTGQQQCLFWCLPLYHRRLHMALPMTEVLQTAKLQFGYLFIYLFIVYQYSYTAPWPKHVAD